jgi:hypothetical protein
MGILPTIKTNKGKSGKGSNPGKEKPAKNYGRG